MKRSVVVKQLKPVPVEAIARGYLIGSGWKDYQRSGELCGIRLPAGLRQADRLPEPIFTPSTKAAVGDHDENGCTAEWSRAVGAELAARVREATLAIYRYAAAYALERRISHRRHQVRVRPGRGRRAARDGRDAYAGLLRASGRPIPMPPGPVRELRQAVRARLPGNAGLEQDRARPESARGGHRPHPRQVRRGTTAPGRDHGRLIARWP